MTQQSVIKPSKQHKNVAYDYIIWNRDLQNVVVLLHCSQQLAQDLPLTRLGSFKPSLTKSYQLRTKKCYWTFQYRNSVENGKRESVTVWASSRKSSEVKDFSQNKLAYIPPRGGFSIVEILFIPTPIFTDSLLILNLANIRHTKRA